MNLEILRLISYFPVFMGFAAVPMSHAFHALQVVALFVVELTWGEHEDTSIFLKGLPNIAPIWLQMIFF